MSPALVVGASFGYLLLLFGVAWFGDKRAAQGRSIVANAWTYALSLAVYCTAWTYFGSVGRAASGGIRFLPIYLGPTLAMVLGWLVLRKMIRIARVNQITSIADFIASRYGKSPLLAGLVTVIALIGVVPYIALQLKAISAGYAILTLADGAASPRAWGEDSTFLVALVLAGFTMMFGTRRLGSAIRHEGMVAAIAFESVVKLAAFLAVGVFVVWGLFDGLADLFARAAAVPALQSMTRLDQGDGFGWPQWFALTLLSMLSVLLLPRQFQVMVIENTSEAHLRRAIWVFPLYLFAINLFVLPIAIGGVLWFGASASDPETFVLSLPLAAGAPGLALFVFIGGLSASTGMVIVEAIAVSTMVSNELVMPLLLRSRHLRPGAGHDLTRLLLAIRRAAILAVLLLGYLYFLIAGEAYALVSIGLISFAAVAQFGPALLGGLYWKGATRLGALTGLAAGFLMWTWTLMLPSIAKSGWLDDSFLANGPWGIGLLRPEALLGLQGLDGLTHSLFWSLLVNLAAYVGVSLWRAPSGLEASQALVFVDAFERDAIASPVFWRGSAKVADLRQLCERLLGTGRTQLAFDAHAHSRGLGGAAELQPDARLVQFVEQQLAGAVGGASARMLIASVAEEEILSPQDVMRILDEASQLRAYARELETKSQSLERASAELTSANEQLKSLDRLKDDFMSSVTHELRTPLTSIRALAELLRDEPDMAAAQRSQFIGIVVTETERLTRLVNQVLDLSKIESSHAGWVAADVDLRERVLAAVTTTAKIFHERGAVVEVDSPAEVPLLRVDADRITQVLLNLLSNAAKFMPAIGGRVGITLTGDDDGLTVSVRDNGPGVPPAERSRIFERFHQGGDEGNRPQGTGLGLPISRRIVEHYGGRLWLDETDTDTDDHGACFCFWLPLPHATTMNPRPEESTDPTTNAGLVDDDNDRWSDR